MHSDSLTFQKPEFATRSSMRLVRSPESRDQSGRWPPGAAQLGADLLQRELNFRANMNADLAQ
jgi:hypothetical protein